MRVLFLTYPRIGLNRGGLQIQIEETAKGLAELGVEVIRYDPWKNQIPNVDICHVFSIDGSMLNYVERSHRTGIPVVISPVFNLFDSSSFLTRVKMRLSHCLPGMYSDLKRAEKMVHVTSRVIALNENEKRLMVAVFGLTPERCTVIPNGMDFGFSAGDPELFAKKFGVRDFLLEVASIENRKNQLTLIRAMRNSPHTLVVIGNASPENTSYLKKCRREAGSNVVFVGALPHGDPLLASAYSAAKLFVLPSYSEVMPLSLYEAAVAGCRVAVSRNVPVAASIAPLIPTFDPNDVQELSACITREMAQTRNMQLQNSVSRMPSWRQVCERILLVYEEGLILPTH